jgi:hypothetical protein
MELNMKQTMNGKYQRGYATCMVKASVQVPQEMRAGLREISKIHTPIAHRRNGDATQLLMAVCEEADTQGFVLLLHVQPYGEPDLGASQLTDWYERFGFQTIQAEPHLMARMVGATPRVLSANPITAAVGRAIEAF